MLHNGSPPVHHHRVADIVHQVRGEALQVRVRHPELTGPFREGQAAETPTLEQAAGRGGVHAIYEGEANVCPAGGVAREVCKVEAIASHMLLEACHEGRLGTASWHAA